MNSTQTLGQTEGLGQIRKWKLEKAKNQTAKTRTYPPTGQGEWSSSVADPSIPPVLRGQQHGPWGSRRLVGKCRWWWFGIGWGWDIRIRIGEQELGQKTRKVKNNEGSEIRIRSSRKINSVQKGGQL